MGVRERYIAWTRRQIDETRAEIRQELQAKKLEIGQVALGRYIIEKIHILADDSSDIRRLQRFVYVMHGLITHNRTNFLSKKECQRLFEIGMAILQTQGISPDYSELAFLYSDLYQARSQTNRGNGAHWQAAWDHELAKRFLVETPPQHHQSVVFSSAKRLFRLGHLRLGVAKLTTSSTLTSDPCYYGLSALMQLMAARLSGNNVLAESIEAALDTSRLQKDVQLDVEWERLCRSVQKSLDLQPLRIATRRNERHYSSDYIIEAALWGMCHVNRQWLSEFTKLPVLLRRTGLNPKQHKRFYHISTELQHCYDTEISFNQRILRLGRVLDEIPKLVTFDKELLCWLAAARFLARSRAYDLAAIALSEYTSLSMRASDGQNRDALSMAQDLIQSAWFDGNRRSVEDLDDNAGVWPKTG